MTEKQASQRLAKGTIVYMIGNLCSKILQMLILPIITAALVTSEYGYYDLIVTTISLATPIVTFQMIEGMFRYMFNASEEGKQQTVSTVLAVLICGLVVLAGLMVFLNFVMPSLNYPFLIYLNYFSSIIFNFTQKLSRCQQMNKQFAISGVLNTITMLAIQAITLIMFHMGVDGMLISNSISYLIASSYLAFNLKIWQWIDRKKVDKKTFFSLLRYSAPLIPNSIGWWIVSSSDKYIITLFLNTSANGIYSMAGKFSQLLTFVTTVFQLAWQESAIMEENSEDRDRFYTNTFNSYMKLLLGGYLMILPLIKILIPILLSESYQIGYLYNPILLIGAIFSAFSQFYGSAYLVFKKTNGAFTTTIIAAIINIGIGVGLIGHIGLFAPALGTAISFMVQWGIRVYQLRGYFRVKIDVKSMLLLILCISVNTIIYFVNNMYLQFMAFFAGMIVFAIFNKNIMISILNKLKRKV